MASELQRLMKEERAAWRAMMNDPKPMADPNAPHTPAIRARWEAAADAEYAYREQHGLLGH